MKQIKVSYLIIFLTIFIIIILAFQQSKWKDQKILISDARIYYAYLPAAIIYHDLYFNFIGQLPEIYSKTWNNRSNNGNKVVKMTMGNSIMWLPFFLIAHTYASVSQFSNNGFSEPYHFMIFISSLFYLTLALLFLRRIIIRYYSEIAASITIFILVFGTNLLYYIVDEPGMTHINSFTLITIFIYYFLNWFEKPTKKISIFLGLLFGLIILIRPVNVVIILFPIIFLLLNIKPFSKLLQFISKNLKLILIALLFALIVNLPQLLYWKIVTDHWIFYSYQDEGFYFLSPKIIDGLFSFRKGWLVYTPLMAISFIGFFFIKKNDSSLQAPIIVTFTVFTYVTYSWWCWWYGGSFGSRPMIDMYGLLAIPFSSFIAFILERKFWIRIAFSIIVGFFVFLNIFQIHQYRLSLLHWDSMTKKTYTSIFLKKTWPKDYDKTLKKPDYQKALKGEAE